MFRFNFFRRFLEWAKKQPNYRLKRERIKIGDGGARLYDYYHAYSFRGKEMEIWKHKSEATALTLKEANEVFDRYKVILYDSKYLYKYTKEIIPANERN